MLFLLQKQELREMAAHVDNLTAECQKHETNLMTVNDCLKVIEKDCTLSDEAGTQLQKAQQCVTDSLDVQTKVVMMQNIGTWLQRSYFTSVRILHLLAVSVYTVSQKSDIRRIHCVSENVPTYLLLSVCQM